MVPDRFGENPDFAAESDPDIARIANRRAIDSCDLCDETGNRNGFPCDHCDHSAAAKRGMDMIREAMGWDTP